MCVLNDKYLLDCALASERNYFALAGEEIHGENFLFAAVPGLGNLPAASVCILDAENLEFSNYAQTIEICEEAFVRAGSRMARFYTGETDKNFAALMKSKLYRRRAEIIHTIAPLPAGQHERSDARWRKVSSEKDWEEKAALLLPYSAKSDGYASNNGEWHSLERLKAATAKIDFWIYTSKEPAQAPLHHQTDLQAIATTGLMQCSDGVTRIKNFFVRSDCRGKGTGKAALRSLLCLLKEHGQHAAILLSIEGSVGERLYRSLGARDIGRIYEWSREL